MWHDSVDYIFQAFCGWQICRVHKAIPRIICRVLGTGSINRRRRYVVASAPHLGLFFAMLRGGRGFVEAL
jgi:hypothetical protein